MTQHSLTHRQAVRGKVSLSLQTLEQLPGNAAELEGLNSPGIMARRDCVSLKKYSPVLDVWAGLSKLQLWMCPLDTPMFLQKRRGKRCEEGTVQTAPRLCPNIQDWSVLLLASSKTSSSCCSLLLLSVVPCLLSPGRHCAGDKAHPWPAMAGTPPVLSCDSPTPALHTAPPLPSQSR